MSKELKNTSDIHHCCCFKIDPKDIDICKSRLEEFGFEKQPVGEINHGQVFGLRRKLNELLQLHFKVMPDGMIESELEPPPEYPGAHINGIHSYSPHTGMAVLLQRLRLKYTIILPIPKTCKLPTIIDPNKPLKWWQIVILGVVVVGVGALIVQALKK